MSIILENRRHIIDIKKKNRKKKSVFKAVLNLEDDELKVTLRLESEVDGVIEDIIDEDIDFYEMSLKPVKSPEQQV